MFDGFESEVIHLAQGQWSAHTALERSSNSAHAVLHGSLLRSGLVPVDVGVRFTGSSAGSPITMPTHPAIMSRQSRSSSVNSLVYKVSIVSGTGCVLLGCNLVRCDV
jgi:hypothetical protein